MFSSNLEFRATRLSQAPHGGTLVFASDEIAFYPNFTNQPEVHFPAQEITDFSLYTSDTRTSEVTLLRIILLKWLALLFPKKSGSVAAIMTIGSPTERVSFQLDNITVDELQPKIIPHLDGWGIVLE